jgi:hypothetical protein
MNDEVNNTLIITSDWRTMREDDNLHRNGFGISRCHSPMLTRYNMLLFVLFDSLR